MVDVLTTEQRSNNMSRIRGKNTKPEMVLRSLLHRSGYRFRLHDKSLPGKPDLVLKKFKSVVFVNGCFWHRHEGCKKAAAPKTRIDFWEKKFARTIERDKEQTTALIEFGWKVITVWECELKERPEYVLRNIANNLSGGYNG
ncbi:very short patch repair endonuclease [Kordiimonas pumila]|uniref:Very short patch repair endonuclease n=1 Tax=Kordiimonas pumila TaxID=2161677 RepID=A0ABV7D0N2_9PROT|nr:very short patch repair endonuclease [Kordiimonas pumila]